MDHDNKAEELDTGAGEPQFNYCRDLRDTGNMESAIYREGNKVGGYKISILFRAVESANEVGLVLLCSCSYWLLAPVENHVASETLYPSKMMMEDDWSISDGSCPIHLSILASVLSAGRYP